MGHAGVIAYALNVKDDVVGVLLKRVVDTRLEVGLGAVVVDPDETSITIAFLTAAGSIAISSVSIGSPSGSTATTGASISLLV